MEILDNFLTTKYLIFVVLFISVATVLVVVCIRAVKRASSLALKNIEKKPPTFMKLKEIQLFPTDASAEVQVVVYVNGVKFIHPAVENTPWIAMDSNLSEKIFELPCAEIYYIRFELNFSSEKKLEGGPALIRSASLKKDTKKATGQEAATYPTIPLVADYKLYFLQDGSRDTSVKAIISYEIYTE